jgi:hypothetical protein
MSNLPQIAQLTFPDADLKTPQTNQQRIHATYDWDFDAGDFALKDGKLVQLTGIDYLIVWIQKALRTVKDTLIYTGTNYGSNQYSLIGRNFHPEFEKSEYKRMILEALLQNDAIIGVESFTFSQTGSRLTIGFTVQSIYGTTNQQAVI